MQTSGPSGFESAFFLTFTGLVGIFLLNKAPIVSTCHLDREGIDFLIDRLKHFPGALVIVHDKGLLANVADMVYGIKDKK